MMTIENLILDKTHPYRDLLFSNEHLADSTHEQDAELSSQQQESDCNSSISVRNGPNHKRNTSNPLDQDFQQAFHPSQMRCLALVSHNGMKATMKKFVLTNKNILKKFRLTGTNSTMTMLKDVFKGDDSVIFGPSCSSGPLGGDAELVALMCAGQLGGMIFFQDPMSSHPHQSDIDCLCRQAIVHNTMIASNPTSALMIMTTLRVALKENMPELIPSFFCTLESPSVGAYKKQQNKVIASHSNSSNLPNTVADPKDDDEPSLTNTATPMNVASNDVTAPAPVRSSAAATASPHFEFSRGVIFPSSNSGTTTSQQDYDNDADSESIVSTMSSASRRRGDARARLVESFATFVDSMKGQSTEGHSLSRSNHSYLSAPLAGRGQRSAGTGGRSSTSNQRRRGAPPVVATPSRSPRLASRSEHSYLYGAAASERQGLVRRANHARPKNTVTRSVNATATSERRRRANHVRPKNMVTRSVKFEGSDSSTSTTSTTDLTGDSSSDARDIRTMTGTRRNTSHGENNPRILRAEHLYLNGTAASANRRRGGLRVL